jgi:rare lipoprotein A
MKTAIQHLLARPGIWLCLVAFSLLASCTSSSPSGRSHDWRSFQTGKASWYGGKFHGRKTASGERYNQHAMTAAHKKLPFGTYVRVTNLKNGRSCVVRINDRGPFVRGRVIDLSAAAAKQIGVYSAGVAPVRLDVPR